MPTLVPAVCPSHIMQESCAIDAEAYVNTRMVIVKICVDIQFQSNLCPTFDNVKTIKSHLDQAIHFYFIGTIIGV